MKAWHLDKVLKNKPETTLLPEIDPAPPASIVPAHYERFANALAGRLRSAGVKITAEVQDDGRVALIMPLEWAYIFMNRLAVEVDVLKEELRKASLEIRRRHAEQQVASEQARERWEKEQASIYSQYRRLMARGLSHRQAFNKIKQDSEGLSTVTLIADAVQKEDARIRQERRRQERRKRDKQIMEMVRSGLKQREIAEREGLTLGQVKEALKRGRRHV